MQKLPRLLFSLCIAGLLPGISACTEIPAGPTPISASTGPNATRFQEIREAIESDCLTIESTTASTEVRRNNLVTAFMYAVDEEYNDYERDLLDAVREDNLGAAEAALGLSTIAGILQDRQIIRSLSGASAIITGTHTAIGRDYLLNQTLHVLITQMRASRAAQRTLLLERLSLDYAAWPTCLALSDALTYEQAGTLTAALVAISASAAEANRENQARAAAVTPRIAYNRGVLATALRTYLAGTSTASPKAARQQRALQAMADLQNEGLIQVAPGVTPGARLARILVGGETEEVRRLLLERIIAAEPDSAVKQQLQTAVNPNQGPQ